MNQQDERLEQFRLDDRLRQLALEAQRHPQGSSARRRALSKLISVLQRSGKLSRPPHLLYTQHTRKVVLQFERAIFVSPSSSP